MKIIDLHSHTHYSADACSAPESLIEKAIAGGVEMLGITDHNYWFEDRIAQYIHEISALKRRYKGYIELLCGMEIRTVPRSAVLAPALLADFDFCIFENVGHPSQSFEDFLAYRKSFPCRAGIAHTDLFAYQAQCGLPVFDLMRENDLFWELNVNYDSIHGYHEHSYVKEFMRSCAQQEEVRRAGIKVSVGFDCHDAAEYDAQRVKEANEFLDRVQIPKPFC